MAETEMESVIKKSFDNPDRTLKGNKAKAEMVMIQDQPVTRFTLNHGARFSKEGQETEGQEILREFIHHVGLQISGETRIRTDAGEEVTLRPGDVVYTPTIQEFGTEGLHQSVFITTPIIE